MVCTGGGTVVPVGRSSTRCAACGGAVPNGAAYCSSCGHPADGVVFEAVPSADPGDCAEVTLGDRPRRRWIVPAVIAVVLALVAAVAIFGGRDEPRAAAPTTTLAPTTTVAPTTSTAPATTTTTLYSTAQGNSVPDANGVVVYLTSNIGEVFRTDIGTGVTQRRRLPNQPSRAGPWTVLARQGGFVVADASYDDQTPVYAATDDPAGATTEIASWVSGPMGDGGPNVAPATESDAVWLWTSPQGGGAADLRLVRLDGTVMAGPVALARYVTVLGADGPGAVALMGPNGFYRATVNGTDVAIEPVWSSLPLAYSPSALVVLACTPILDCHVEVVDRATGARRPVPNADLTGIAYGTYDSTVSADGRWLALVRYEGSDGPRLQVYDLSTGAMTLDDDIMPTTYGPLGPPRSATFSSDGRWLVYLSVLGDIKLWSVGSGGPSQTVSVPGLDHVASASVAPA